VVVPDANILPLPGNLSFVEGAALPLVFLTAWQMLVLKGRVQPGHTVLIHGASGGVSTAAIQIAKLFGARVLAVTSNASKAEGVRALGADEVIVRSTHDFVDETKRLTGGRGADLIVDHVGGDVLTRSVLAAAWGGRIVTCGATAGVSSQIDLRHLFFRQIEILGSTMGPKGALWTILDFVRAGKLRPVVHSSFSLWQAADAHRELASGNVFGKVVLEVA
jgi:NADPH:quinone reductase-like Zn-dependent oxidoreductase